MFRYQKKGKVSRSQDATKKLILRSLGRMSGEQNIGVYRWEVYSESDDKLSLFDRHLNFDVRYDVVQEIVTHKVYCFHKQQVAPSVSKCNNEDCDEALCRLPDKGFTSALDAYKQLEPSVDPMIGKRVAVRGCGFVTIKHPDGESDKLDLNWQRL